MTINIKINKYTLIEEIGRGGYGTVYRAVDETLQIERAVKVLHPALVADLSFIERFREEARLVARLKHPHILSVYALGEDQGRFYLVMDYMPGGSLKELLAEDGPMTFQRSLEVLKQIASALNYAHGQELVHRDVKPGNILFDAQGNAYLTDFGFAKSLATADSSTTMSVTGGILGTPAYMAPEAWDGKGWTPAADVYSLACVFFEMLVGVPLFDGDTPTRLMKQHVIEGPQFPKGWPKGVPEGIESELSIATANKAETRYSGVEKFAESLNRLKKETQKESRDAETDPNPLRALVPGPIAPVPDPSLRRRKWNWGIVGIIVVFIFAALAIGGGGLIWYWYIIQPTATVSVIQSTTTPRIAQTHQAIQPTTTPRPPSASTPTLTVSTHGYDTVFPLPPDVQDFTGSGDQVNFATGLTVDEAIAYYREALTAMGLVERDIHTAVTEATFSMVFDGHPNGKAVVIQGVDLGNGTTNINIRFEDV